jgi:hypothetical protein
MIIKIKTIKTTFMVKERILGKKLKKGKGNQPPKKRITFIELIKIIFAYSPIKKKAKPTEEYSTL